MSEVKQCPNCGQMNAVVLMRNDRKKTVCRTCGWDGPACFGEFWEPHNPKCHGGNDPNYWDAEKKSHQRPQCGLYQICASEMNRRKVQGFTPITNLIKQQQTAVAPQMQLPQPPMGQPPPQVVLPMVDGTKRAVPSPMMPPLPTPPKSIQVKPMAPVYPTQQAVPQTMPAQQVQPMMYYQQGQGGQPIMVMMVPPEQAGMPALVPQNTVHPGAQVPSVIVVPEGEQASYPKRFFGSVGRAMLKHGFLQAANMMDHVPWSR